MSFLSYNGISLQLIKTNSVTRIPRLSDDHTEYMWTDFIIDVRFIYNPAATSYNAFGIAVPGMLPPTTDSGIRSLLLQKRAALLYQEGGQNILQVLPNLPDGSTLDSDNGPTPLSININRIGSSRIFEGNYIVKASIVECVNGSLISAIASSRYSRTEDIDQDYLSTLNTSGTTYFRTNILAALGNVADFYRSYLIPPLLLGYKRERINFSIKSDGSSITWSCVDVEQKQELGSLSSPGTAASYGITQMGLNYSTSLLQGGPMGTASYGSICTASCWAQGMRFSDRYGMLQFCIRVAYQKLAQVAPLGMVSGGEITEDVFANRVSMTISYLVLDDGQGDADLLVPIIGTIGDQLPLPSLPNNTGVNPQPPFAKGTRGTAGYELAVSGFMNACANTTGGDTTGNLLDPQLYVPGTQYGTGPIVQPFPDPGLPAPQLYNPSLRQRGKRQQRGSLGNKSIYKAYAGRSSTVNTGGIIQVPIASIPSSSSSGSSSPGLGSTDSTGSSTPANTSVNLQLFQATAKKVVEWSVERIGAVPELPDPTVPQSYANNFTLLNATVTPLMLEAAPDGYSVVYRCSGVYTYSIVNPAQIQNITFDIPPWLNITANAYTELQASDFEDGIINNPQV
jgi:hypothetical protein